MKKVKIFILGIIFAVFAFFPVGFPSDQKTHQTEIDRINNEIDLQGLEWQAGITSLTQLSPEEKRKRVGTWNLHEAAPDEGLFI